MVDKKTSYWLNKIFCSYDFIFSILCLIISLIFIKYDIKNQDIFGFYGIIITIVSILFSIYFASLAIIITYTDSDFIIFLEEGDNCYSKLISSFKITLFIIFISLIISLICYIYTLILISNNILNQSRFILIFFIFIFSYSLFCSIISTYDSIKFAKTRIRFINEIKKKENSSNKKE